MNIKNYSTKLALASITLISAVSFAPSAIAQDATANFNFNGTVPSSCAWDSGSTTANINTPLTYDANTYSFNGTTATNFSASCNSTSATVKIDSVALLGNTSTHSTPNTIDVTLTRTSAGSGNTVRNITGGSLTPGATDNTDSTPLAIGVGTHDFSLGLSSAFSNIPLPSTYTYTVVLTLTP